MKIIVGILLLLSLVFWTGGRIYKAIRFNIDCSGHMVRAAHANTTPLAREEMRTVVKYLEQNTLTNGYTSIIFKTPDEDVEFFYSNLKTALGELGEISPESSLLEQSNVLMKLRETLISRSSEGSTIHYPSGLSIFPNNLAWMIWGIVSIILGILGLILIGAVLEDRY